jgi:membrane associated rhomboid family serine protease
MPNHFVVREARMLPIPIGTDRPQRRVPWMNYALIAANVIIYLLSHSAQGAHIPPQLAKNAGLVGDWANGILSADHPQLYQFFTYQFLHANFTHILGNMLFLWVFGNNLNEKLGHLSYLTFYLAGGVLAGCGQLLTENTSTLGASGSISAVTGLYLALLPRTNIRIWIWFFYVGIYEIPSMYFIMLNIAKDLFEQFYLHETGVAYQAHLAGALAGLIIGMVLLWTKLVQRDHYDMLSLINRWRRRRAYEALVDKGAEFYLHSNRAGGIPPAKMRNETPIDPKVFDARERVFSAIRNRKVEAAAAAYVDLRKLDPEQVLTEDVQLDVANQLMTESNYADAAAAYEGFLRVYPRVSRSPQVQLMLGVLYARYMPNHARAAELLKAALEKLHNPDERALAESELAALAKPSAS